MSEPVIYVIWCNEERKRFIETQLKSIRLPFPVVYWKASTPDDSGGFLDPTSPVPPKLQCCFLSHVRALQHFVNAKEEGSHCLLLEDDVCILRDGFLPKFHELLASYKANPRIDYVTLGYLPVTKANEALHTKLHMLDKDGNLYYNFARADFTVWGSQAQLFTREAAGRIVSVLHQPTAAAVLEAVEKRLITHTSHQNKLKHVMIDALLPLLFSQAIAYPPLFVENNAPSTIHTASETIKRNKTWRQAEATGMFNLRDYYMEDTVVVYVIYCEESRKSFIETQLARLSIPFPVVYWKASTPATSHDFIDTSSSTSAIYQCCFRSHSLAVKHFYETATAEFCIVLEDDACFLVEGVLPKLYDVINAYKRNPAIDYVSLGYLPMTLKQEPLHKKISMLTKDGSLYYDFSRADFTVWGTQSHLISREKARSMVTLFGHSTAKQVFEAIQAHLMTHSPKQNKCRDIQSDVLFPLLFSQAIVYPPLVIETNGTSSLGTYAAPQRPDWVNAERMGMLTLSNYYSFSSTPSKISKKIGIVIHNKANLFTNGITQNAYFMFQCLESIGYTCQFLCNEENPSPFDHKDLKLQQISLNSLVFDPSEYQMIITVTRGFGKDVYDMLKRNKVAVISFVCGNHYMVDQEEFLHGVPGGKSSFKGKDTCADELWIIPSYHHMVEYLEILTGKPGFLVPHLWSSEMIRLSAPKVIKQPEERLFYDITKRTSNKINILILEPNMSFFKTAWMPIMAGEKLYRDRPELVEFVFAFNYPDNNHAYVMADSLTLGPKLRKFKRLSIQEILYHFNQENGCYPIFVSHQVLNSLNYLYYELLYYGFPLVHNSPDLDGCGYYYPDNNISKCVEAILYAHKHHDNGIETYKAKAREYLKRVDPLDTGVQSTFDQFVKASTVKHSR